MTLSQKIDIVAELRKSIAAVVAQAEELTAEIKAAVKPEDWRDAPTGGRKATLTGQRYSVTLSESAPALCTLAEVIDDDRIQRAK